MTSENSNIKDFCPNCNKPFVDTALYCYQCGQKQKLSRISVLDLVMEFFETVFNFDSKFYKTIAAIFIPGALTKAYFAGKRKSYVTPIKLFFVTLLLHLTAMFYLIGEIQVNLGGKEKIEARKKEIALVEKMDTIRQDLIAVYPRSQSSIDSFYNVIKKETKYKSLETDSIDVSIAAISLDDGTNTQFKVSKKDIFELEPKEVLDKYSITGFWNRLFSQQSIRVFKEGGSYGRALGAKLSWIGLLIVPLIAMFMKLLYIRRSHFYVEHLVFLFHVHALIFLIAGLMFLLAKWGLFNFSGAWALITFIILALIYYVYKAMKVVYRQKTSKTLLKLIILGISYFICACLSFVFVAALTFLLF